MTGDRDDERRESEPPESGRHPKARLSTDPETLDSRPAPSLPPVEIRAGFDRYRQLGALGVGGMGEVLSSRDTTIGRDIAMKVIRPDRVGEDGHARFLLEARVQGQLEHPSVVPVYDLGEDPRGNVFFTMKRVRGRTLEAILAERVDGIEREEYGTRRLLTDLSKLALAVHFVHEHGVVHRDIKPSNIMLGDYGEVYLLDWGLAKIVGEAEPEATSKPPELGDSAPAETSYGTLMGTPGYMSPEQTRAGEEVGPAADVYALGVILYEILAGVRLHDGDNLMAVLHSTTQDVEHRPSARAPERQIAPELDQLVADATRLDRHVRIDSAREMHDRLERFLDGDRDLARRRARAKELVAEAANDDDRTKALQKLGHALAFDPENRQALESLLGLLTSPPKLLPDAVRSELADLEARQTRHAGRIGALVFLTLNLYLPILLWMGVKSWLPMLLFSMCSTATGLVSWGVSKLTRPTAHHAMVVLTLGLLTASTSSVLFGPFVLTPGLIAVIAIAFSLNNPIRWRFLILGLSLAAMFAPVALEGAGIVPPSIVFEGDALTMVPRFTALRPAPTLLVLVMMNLAVLLTGIFAITPLRRELDEAQLRIRLSAWQLRQLVGDGEGLAPREDEH